MSTPSRRVHGFDGPHQLLSGEYGKWHDTWWASTPNGLGANLASHEVTEHADGTITVSPSILVTDGAAGHRWHGYLEAGVWREC